MDYYITACKRTLLWLDDKRNPFLDEEELLPDTEMANELGIELTIHWVRSYKEFTAYLMKHGLPYYVSFDHDLAPEHYAPEHLWDDYEKSKKYQELKYPDYEYKTGKDCARALVNLCNQLDKPLPSCVVHSANPVGANWIKLELAKYK